MPTHDSPDGFQIAVKCYLSTLQAIANAVAKACPQMGGPYRHRLSRLRARLAFDSSPQAIEESSQIAAEELKEYAEKASGYLTQHRAELRGAVSGMGAIIRNLTSCVDSLDQGAQSLLTQMRETLERIETRLEEAEITDPVTGLMNRREMERRIAAAVSEGSQPVLLLFDFDASLPGELAQQVGARLASQFRYNDLVARWSDHQFLVMFQGSPEIAQARGEQVTSWINGRYLLDTGEVAQVASETRLVDAAHLTAPEPAAVSAV